MQAWSDKHQWWIPNTVHFSLKDEQGDDTLPMTHGHQWLNSTNTVNKQLFLYNYQIGNNVKVDFKFLYHITTGTKYIYPVEVASTNYFFNNKTTGFKHIDSRVIDDCKKGLAKIVLLFPFEGTCGSIYHTDDFEILNQWCIASGLTKSDVYFIHGNMQGPRIAAEHSNFTYIYLDVFKQWVVGLNEKITEYAPINEQNLFLSYNRQPRVHRTLLMCELIKSKLLDAGIVSYHGGDIKDFAGHVEHHGWPDLQQEAQLLAAMIPMEIDTDLGKNNPAVNLVPDHYKRTLFSIITETLTDNNVIFFSEKTWKTIGVGHPFMIVGSMGILQELQNQGFKTFSRWWDESYDQMENLRDRVQIIVNETKKLSKLSLDSRKQIHSEMQDTLTYNLELFNKIYNQQRPNNNNNDLLYNTVLTIWKSF